MAFSGDEVRRACVRIYISRSIDRPIQPKPIKQANPTNQTSEPNSSNCSQLSHILLVLHWPQMLPLLASTNTDTTTSRSLDARALLRIRASYEDAPYALMYQEEAELLEK